MSFREITPTELGGDVFSMFHRGMLLTAQAGDKINTMTVGWGTLGVMWGKNVMISAVRPERYTYSLMEESDTFSMALLPAEDKAKLGFCGTIQDFLFFYTRHRSNFTDGKIIFTRKQTGLYRQQILIVTFPMQSALPAEGL